MGRAPVPGDCDMTTRSVAQEPAGELPGARPEVEIGCLGCGSLEARGATLCGACARERGRLEELAAAHDWEVDGGSGLSQEVELAAVAAVLRATGRLWHAERVAFAERIAGAVLECSRASVAEALEVHAVGAYADAAFRAAAALEDLGRVFRRVELEALGRVDEGVAP
ncbi:MAG: hypothetical protein BWX64_00295 [Acidobacteria bacterium ADurb.Bin051]|nr:MAG: hypothetical protein BWX64_00295 [Acidobacteria bacterium ADurb.Bin051]